MINLLLGAPGGGKSYEAVVHHILPAIAQGRKVITNLPVNVAEFEKLHPGAAALFDLRITTKAPRPVNLETVQDTQRVTLGGQTWRPIPFWHPADFADEWRHPEKGYGPLYVIDECHIPLPVRGTMIQVEEWFSLHRHHNADVLLITQSYGKINAAIRDLVQVVYRVRKNVALGSMGSYTRKVQDGLRGEVVNTSIRKYEPHHFPLYKSHTQSSSGSELGANDIRPFWKHWTFMGSGAFVLVFMVMLFTGQIQSPFSGADVKAQIPPGSKPETVSAKPPPKVETVSQVQPGPPPQIVETVAAVQLGANPEKPEPFEGMSIHIRGHLKMGSRENWYFVIGVNGVPVTDVDANRLREAGYTWRPVDHCIGWLDYPGKPPRALRCDMPSVSPTMRSTT